MEQRWWQRSVVYQIYPRSFCDSNGDGIGDLNGITSKLDHLAALGVDVVWLSPVYASPNDDNGYDISDYRSIMAEFGTMADFERMLAGMRARGIRLMMDLVVNHTSDEHGWFRRARASRDDPFHDWYVWREPAPGGGPPNNWEAAFGGSAWQWNEATGEYYLHLFSPKQPDLNWENPAVREAVHALMRFWLDKGVAGFRMDVINMISKPWRADGSLPDAPLVQPGFLQPAFRLVTHGPRLLEFLHEMRREVLDHYDTITVGEAPCATPEQGIALTHPETGALGMLFQFEHMDLDTRPGAAKWAWRRAAPHELMASLMRWQQALDGRGWNSLYLSNHDQPRPVSRFGDDGEHRVASAKALATFLHGLQGTPYVYQGEELGMRNPPFASVDELRDIESLNHWREAVQQRGEDPAAVLESIRRKGRDNARTPMPWDASPNAGFGTGTPWIAPNPDYPEVNAAQARADPDSVFHHYRRLIALRRERPVLALGRTQPLPAAHPQVCAWLRDDGSERLLVVCNLGPEPARFVLPDAVPGAAGAPLIANLPAAPAPPWRETPLRAWEARIHPLH